MHRKKQEGTTIEVCNPLPHWNNNNIPNTSLGPTKKKTPSVEKQVHKINRVNRINRSLVEEFSVKRAPNEEVVEEFATTGDFATFKRDRFSVNIIIAAAKSATERKAVQESFDVKIKKSSSSFEGGNSGGKINNNNKCIIVKLFRSFSSGCFAVVHSTPPFVRSHSFG